MIPQYEVDVLATHIGGVNDADRDKRLQKLAALKDVGYDSLKKLQVAAKEADDASFTGQAASFFSSMNPFSSKKEVKKAVVDTKKHRKAKLVGGRRVKERRAQGGLVNKSNYKPKKQRGGKK